MSKLTEVDAESAEESSQVSRSLMGILFSVSTIAALLYFIGRARTQSMHVTLGIPAGLVNMSPIDYATAGVEVALPFLVLVAISAIALFAAHRAIALSALAKPLSHRANKAVRLVQRLAVVIGVLGLGVGFAGVLDLKGIGHALGPAIPVTLLGGAGVLAYILLVPSPTSDRSGKSMIIVLTSLSVVGLLWTSALYGKSVGIKFAQHFAANSAQQPDVMLLSRTRLQIVGPGVTVEELPYEDRAAYQFCYRGLRYLMENDEYLIFAPVGWTPGVDHLILIPAKADIRFDSGPARSDLARPVRCSDR